MLSPGVFNSNTFLAIDTETTGVDFHHGTMPYFITVSDEEGNIGYWEWDVNPVTRQPIIPEDDVDEIAELFSPNETGCFIFQNAKFDVAALRTIRQEFGDYWRWECTVDTLIGGHVLASGMPHSLTDMATHFAGINIDRVDEKLHNACVKARRIARSKFPDWRIAKKGLDDMPSVTSSDGAWKADAWLCRAVAKELEYEELDPECEHKFKGEHCIRCEGHHWWIVLSEYANVDSAITAMVWKAQRQQLKSRGLVKLFETRMHSMRLAYKMEARGINLSQERLDELTEQYQQESDLNGETCVKIAERMGFELSLPKSGNNKLLTEFSSDKEGLNLHELIGPNQKRYGKGSFIGKAGQPLLNQECMRHYEVELVAREPRGRRLRFIRALGRKRKRDTALTYMNAYRRFWIDVEGLDEDGWKVIFPSLNPTGTSTLRWTSNNPNEQNISKREGFNLRYAFGPLPGREWWAIDAQNIELRLPAYEAGEQAMIDLFEKPDEPPYFGSNHLLSAHVLHKKAFEECINEDGIVDGRIFKDKYKSTLYQWIKNGNFAVQYGAVPESGTADRAYHVEGGQLRIQARFARMQALNQKCIQFANRHGYVETIPDKTVDARRGYPLMCSRTERGKIKPTVPLNYHIQGTAMQWMQKAMIRCDAYLEKRNWKLPKEEHAWIAMQVHDELVFDLPYRPDFGNLDTIKELTELMEMGGDDIGIPTPCSVEYHPNNWSEGHSVKLTEIREFRQS